MFHRIVLLLSLALLATTAGSLILLVIAGTAPTWGSALTLTFWFGLLKEFQTLVAGVLAVLAALVTVYMAERSERQNARRHGDLMSISLREDALKVDRLFNPEHRVLKHQLEIWEDFAAAMRVKPRKLWRALAYFFPR